MPISHFFRLTVISTTLILSGCLNQTAPTVSNPVDTNQVASSTTNSPTNQQTQSSTASATPTDANPITPTDYRDLPNRTADLSLISEGFDAPWAFTWVSANEILVTERFGTLKRFNTETQEQQTVSGLPEVFTGGQGGLLDVTVHPDFAENNWVYFSFAHGSEEGNRLRVARGVLNDTVLENVEVIFEVAQTKIGGQHFGSRFTWLPDQTLLFSVGDGGNPPTRYNGELIREQTQNLTAHLGKVLRLKDDGSIPEDNPFVGRPDVRPEIWSYGHRNIQGLTYDASQNQVIASEHGSKGGDELNYLQPSENYGWPEATYSTEYDFRGTPISDAQALPETISPEIAWTPTVAPSSVVHYDGNQYEASAQNDLFLAAMLLRANTTIAAYAFNPAGAILRIMTDENGQITGQEKINVGQYRVRSIAQGPDGFLYVLTDSTAPQSRPGQNQGALWRLESF